MRTVIGQFSRPYSPARPAKMRDLSPWISKVSTETQSIAIHDIHFFNTELAMHYRAIFNCGCFRFGIFVYLSPYSTLNKMTQFWLVESSTINPKLYSVGVPIKLLIVL